jgi:hypothetical protein
MYQVKPTQHINIVNLANFLYQRLQKKQSTKGVSAGSEEQGEGGEVEKEAEATPTEQQDQDLKDNSLEIREEATAAPAQAEEMDVGEYRCVQYHE